jgi:hypothetical protein
MNGAIYGYQANFMSFNEDFDPGQYVFAKLVRAAAVLKEHHWQALVVRHRFWPKVSTRHSPIEH